VRDDAAVRRITYDRDSTGVTRSLQREAGMWQGTAWKQGWGWMPGLICLAAIPASLLFAAEKVRCEGKYPQHLQGICLDTNSVYWCYTTVLVKTDGNGQVLRKIPVADHHGDLCLHDGKIYVAVNLGKFNEPPGQADSWVYIYQASDLKFLAKHATPEVVHGAGGIGVRDGRFYVVGGLPAGVNENYVYEYDDQFVFQKRHVVASGPTELGIQTATFSDGRWYFGCYGNPEVLLVTDADFRLIGRFEFNCSCGVATRPRGGLVVADNIRLPNKEHQAELYDVKPDSRSGLQRSD